MFLREAKKRQPAILIQAYLSGLALFTNLTVEEVAYAGIQNSLLERIYTILEQLRQGMSDSVLLLTVLIAGLYLFYRRLWLEKDWEPVRGTGTLCAVLAALHVGGLAFYTQNTLSVLWVYKVNLLRALIAFAGMYFLYLAAVNALYQALNGRLSAGKDAFCRSCPLRSFRARHGWLLRFGLVFMCWLPHLILRYPGAMSYDNYNELMYYYGDKTFTTAQPVFHTWLFGTFVDAGVRLGHPNAGLFAFILLQSLIMAAVLSAMLYLMHRWKTAAWLQRLSFLIIVIAPYYTGYAAFPVKDYLYTAFAVVLVLMIMEYIREPEVFRTGKARALLPACWVVCCTLLMMMRNNGVYVYLLTVLLLVPALVRSAKGGETMGLTAAKTGRVQPKEKGAVCPGRVYPENDGRRRFLLTALVCLLLPLGLKEGTEAVITAAYDVQQDSAKEMFSLPFQQTARYVRDYGDEVTQEEAEAIGAVLDYENLAELYNESISDPVKTTYHAQDTQTLVRYFRVWFTQLGKHPLCYVEATWNQCYSLFTLWTDNIVYNLNCHVGVDIWDAEGSAFFHFTIPGWMSGFCEIAVSLYAALTSLPVIGLFSNVAFYVILLFALLTFFLSDGRLREAKVLIPLLLTFFFLLLSPAVMGQPRYAFPVIYAMPAVLAFYESGRRPYSGETAPDT